MLKIFNKKLTEEEIEFENLTQGLEKDIISKVNRICNNFDKYDKKYLLTGAKNETININQIYFSLFGEIE